ncbi:MAG TPA: hypothetical protein VMY98_00280 [Anaerolineae bacterium]|nr:hypothetical protein [Anaerolineae bacterium]
MTSMNDRDKLRVLLPHWIEHNKEHADEFRHWAERAGPAQSDVLEAAGSLEAVNRVLTRALDKLGGPLAHDVSHSHDHVHN